MSRRFKLTLEYDGADFSGFQRQESSAIRTVQSVLEKTAGMILNENIVVHGAGRTDAGVHARAQVVHFDTSRDISPERLCYALGRQLPDDLVVCEAALVDDSFHARKSALGKYYCYHVFNGKPRPAIGHRYVTFEPQPLDRAVLREMLRPLEGRHHFGGFCGRGATTETDIRTLYIARLEEKGDWLYFHFVGDGFLRKMVRNIVGTVLDGAAGRKPVYMVRRALESQNRTHAGTTAPAMGLFLEAIYYDRSSLMETIARLSRLSTR